MTAIYTDLNGKGVIVTGGGSGIGAEIVRAFARQKAKVTFLDIAVEPSTALMNELTAQGLFCQFYEVDLREIDQLQVAISQAEAAMGRCDILINNAAHDERHATEDVTSEYFDERVAVNLKHQFFAAQAVLPGMRNQGSGVIINFGSISWMKYDPGMVVYTACKSAVLGLTRSLAKDYGPYNIRVNAIAPGWIFTQRQIDKWLTPEAEQAMLQGQCLKRRLQPEELAKFTVFLASEEASACTGQHYVVDGGWV